MEDSILDDINLGGCEYVDKGDGYTYKKEQTYS